MYITELPDFIYNPVTGNRLDKQPPLNGVDLSVAEFFDESTECYDPYVMRYSNGIENIYISYQK